MYNNSITYNGKNSADFGLIIKKDGMSIPQPEQVRIEETVPYMNGSYDFSFMSGKAIYKTREISVTFVIHGKDESEVFRKKIDVISWLTSARDSPLYISCIRNYHFVNATAVFSTESFKFISRTVAELTVQFKAYPYLQSRDYGQQLWDEFNFNTDYLNLTEYVSESNDEYTEFTFFNGENETITPQVTFTKSTSSDYRGATMQISGESGAYGTAFPLVEGTQTYTVASSGIIKFYPGYTNFKIKGLGSVSFSATAEVL